MLAIVFTAQDVAAGQTTQPARHPFVRSASRQSIAGLTDGARMPAATAMLLADDAARPTCRSCTYRSRRMATSIDWTRLHSSTT